MRAKKREGAERLGEPMQCSTRAAARSVLLVGPPCRYERDSAASEGSCGSAALEGRVPLAAEYEAWFDVSDGGLSLRPKGASGSTPSGGSTLGAIEHAT